MKFCALAETLRMSLRELQIRTRLLLHYDFVNEQVAVSACPGVPQGNGPRVFCDYPQERSVCFWKMESVVGYVLWNIFFRFRDGNGSRFRID